MLGGVGQNDLDNIQVTGAEDLPAVEVGPPAVEVGPPAVEVGPPAVVVGTPADLASGQVDLPADGSPAVAARPVVSLTIDTFYVTIP